MSEDSSRLWALGYYYTALEIAPLLKLPAYFGLQQSSVSLPQQSRVCVRVRDCRVLQKRTMRDVLSALQTQSPLKKENEKVSNR